MKKAGYELVELSFPDEKSGLNDKQIGYVFGLSERNIPLWVHEGRADLGALSNLDMDNPKTIPMDIKEDIMVVHESAPYPRAILVVGRHVDEQRRKALRKVLMEAANDEVGQRVIFKYKKVTKYDELPEKQVKTLNNLSASVR